MNQAQYDAAKDIVLDLLGWAVPPDYLLDCGVSREIIFYVFSELNLRLPDNLDVTGLIPYLPITIPSSHVDHSYTSLDSLTMPPPPVPFDAGRRPLSGHPSLPPKPVLTGAGSPSQSSRASPPMPNQVATSNIRALSPNEAVQSTIASNLHDMERQRRQELLARKAVQASRRNKPAAPPSETDSIASSAQLDKDTDVEMASFVPSETVEDFLNSIGPGTDNNSTDLRYSNGDETMDVDEIPGLSRSASSSFLPESSYVNTQSGDTMYADQLTVSPSSAEFATEADGALSRERSNSSVDDQLALNQSQLRRGSKRPVAADFVDTDGPRHHANGVSNGTHHPPLRHIRRKGSSFASVSTMRRCVIDLSDSDGEGDEYTSHDLGEYERNRDANVNGSGYSSPVPTRAVVAAGGAVGWDAHAPPHPHVAPAGTGSSRTMSPAALMEKEKEIWRMRQMIAEREQSSRAKKLTVSACIVRFCPGSD